MLAQIEIYPIVKTNAFSGEHAVARTKEDTPISMPFWDDFSAPANTGELWSLYTSVWINQGMAIDAPTFNVATFDGLDASGIPYSSGPSQNLDYGFTDSLVSRKIKMTEVPLFERNSVFLSFYYQWSGNGEAPDANDFLVLELLNNTGTWEPAVILQSDVDQEPDQFYPMTVRINQEDYYHDDFQFRFRSFGRRSGRYDTWNIDYVYLNKGRNETDLDAGFPDRAVFRFLSPLFGAYYAMPMNHFRTDPQGNTGLPSFGISNVSSIPQPMNYTVNARITQFDNGSSSVQTQNVTSAEPVLPSVVGFEKRVIEMTKKPNFVPFVTADSLAVNYTLILVTGDSINTGYEPIDFHINDTIRQDFVLKDYYSYDDGAAEYAAGLTQTGNQVAYRFIAQSKDTLNGVYVHYPYTAGASATTVTFTVWDNQNGLPGGELVEELVPVQQSGNNEFVVRPFIQSVIVSDTFYIGWRQPATGRVQVGLDASNDTGDQMYINTNGSWVQNTLVRGSLMIRPRFGPGDVITSAGEELKASPLYPNPSHGIFYTDRKITDMHIYSSTGQMVTFETEPEGDKTMVKVNNPSPGLYILRYKIGLTVRTEKIIIR